MSSMNPCQKREPVTSSSTTTDSLRTQTVCPSRWSTRYSVVMTSPGRTFVLGLHPLAVFWVHHEPPEVWVLAILREVAREGLDPGAHVYRGIRAPYLLQVYDSRNFLDQRAVPVLGLLESPFGTLASRDVAQGGYPDGSTLIHGPLPPYFRIERRAVFSERHGFVRFGRVRGDVP